MSSADRRRTFAVTAVVVLLALDLGGAAAPVQSGWHRVDTPNFVVIGEGDAAALREIARKFEAFRELLGRLVGGGLTSSVVPTVITVFASDRSFTPFKPIFKGKRVDAAGLFVPGRDLNHIAMVNNDDSPGHRVVFHEYSHLVMANTGRRMPLWFREGLAEYYSTFQIGGAGRYAEIGHVLGSHLDIAGGLRTLPLVELLNVTPESPLYNEGNRVSVFYAQAWALTHFLLQSEPSLAPQLATYLAEFSRGVPQADAWQTAFGKQDIAGALDRYIRRGSFTATQFKFPEKVAAIHVEPVRLTPADVLAHQADVFLQLEQPQDAADRIAQALKIDPTHARARVARARLEVARGEYERGAKEMLGLPVTGDWLLDYLAGVTVADAAERRRLPPTPEDLQAARKLLHRAPAGLDPFPNAMARMVALEIYSTAGPTVGSRAVIERARALAPGRGDYILLHAQVLARLSEFAAARDVLGPLMNPVLFPLPVRDAARSLMGRIVELENGSTRIDSSGTITRPAFREVRPGEQRIEGVLEIIECGAGGSATFLVRSGADVTRVTAAHLTDVDFIAYRSDLKGSVECGPMKPALPVYVTWRAGTAAGSKIAVAIEFLPK
jgi:hypothetical protein